MNKFTSTLTLALLLFTGFTARAQTLYESAEEVRVELRDQFRQKLITSSEVNKLGAPLGRILDLEEELSLTGREDRETMGQRCERTVKVNELRFAFERLKAVKVRNKRARERLKPLLNNLQSVVEAHGPGDNGECAKLKGSV